MTTTTRSTRPRAASGRRSSRRSPSATRRGQPILVGTISVEVSEMLSDELTRQGIDHVVLNAKPEHAQREGETIAQAGRVGAVTIATNMAGRGVDIKLGGDPEHDGQGGAAQARRLPGGRELRAGAGRAPAPVPGAVRGRGREGDRGRRAVHLRHRAPRVAADRQPAPRPLRSPGRPGRVALLPLGRGRADPPVRRRPDLQDPRPAGPRRRARRGVPARGEDAQPHGRERPEEGRAAELPDPQARARVRRRHERAAPGDLQVPARDPRGARHVRRLPRGDRRGRRATGRGVHAGRGVRGLGPRRPADPGRPAVAARRRPGPARRGQLGPRGDRPRPDRGRPGAPTSGASRSWATS